MVNINQKTLLGTTFIDLFAGIGGFRIALESFGAKCVYSNEWDKYAKQTYLSNFGELPDDDITKVDASRIPDHDILCAGFPCQAFSISGNQRGFEDSRGTLFFDVVRIVKEKRPKVIFLENVKNFQRHDNGKTMQVVKSSIEDLGYSFSYKVLNAANFGVPQKRERIYMVGINNGSFHNAFSFPRPIKLEKHLVDILLREEELSEILFYNKEYSILSESIETQFSSKPVRLGIVNKGGQGERIYSPLGIAITLSAHGGGIFAKTGGYMINGKIRKLHPRECARLMGFPDSYKIVNNWSQAYKQFGNSVVVDVLQYITDRISVALNNASVFKQEDNEQENGVDLTLF